MTERHFLYLRALKCKLIKTINKNNNFNGNFTNNQKQRTFIGHCNWSRPFAFIAGDAWKILQPHQGAQNVGEVNGESLSAQDYQKMVEELSEVYKLTSGLNSLSDEQLTGVKDQVWRTYVENQLIAAQAEKLGLTVTKAEIQAIIDEGTHPLLAQTPFRNPQTGAFDKDMLKKFLVDYANLGKSQMPAQYVEYYQKLGTFWQFVEKHWHNLRWLKNIRT